MQEYLVSGETLPSAYHRALLKLSQYGRVYPCPDYNTTQKEISITIHVENALKEPMISRLFIGGARELEQYRQEILYGIMDFEVEKGNWDYTYHQRMEEQFQFILNELCRNPDSRRAVIDVRDWRLDVTKDSPPCLQHIQYFIRDNKLHCKVLFRSNDACKAAFMNMFALIMLQKEFADKLGYEVGSYSHKANSFHAYEKDFDLLNSYVNRISALGAVTYDYVGDWQDAMESAQADIAAAVNSLKTDID